MIAAGRERLRAFLIVTLGLSESVLKRHFYGGRLAKSSQFPVLKNPQPSTENRE
jgi:hypothetical protein